MDINFDLDDANTGAEVHSLVTSREQCARNCDERDGCSVFEYQILSNSVTISGRPFVDATTTVSCDVASNGWAGTPFEADPSGYYWKVTASGPTDISCLAGTAGMIIVGITHDGVTEADPTNSGVAIDDTWWDARTTIELTLLSAFDHVEDGTPIDCHQSAGTNTWVAGAFESDGFGAWRVTSTGASGIDCLEGLQGRTITAFIVDGATTTLTNTYVDVNAVETGWDDTADTSFTVVPLRLKVAPLANIPMDITGLNGFTDLEVSQVAIDTNAALVATHASVLKTQWMSAEATSTTDETIVIPAESWNGAAIAATNYFAIDSIEPNKIRIQAAAYTDIGSVDEHHVNFWITSVHSSGGSLVDLADAGVNAGNIATTIQNAWNTAEDVTITVRIPLDVTFTMASASTAAAPGGTCRTFNTGLNPIEHDTLQKI